MKAKTILLLMALFLLPFYSNAQEDSTWNAIQNKFEKQFDNYQKKVESQYNKFVDENDKQFTNFLKKSWKEVQMKNGLIKKDKPKPTVKPVINKKETNKETNAVVIIAKQEKDTLKKEVNNYIPIIPGIQKKEDKNSLFQTLNFVFYGTNISVEYDKNLQTRFTGNLKPEDIANFWETLSKTNHYRSINDLLDTKHFLQLPDWGYLKLVEKFSETLFPGDNNSATMLSWFLLNKSRYKIKLAYSRIKAYLLIPSPDLIFRTRFYTFNNIRYYIFDNDAPRVYTYEGNYPDAKMLVSTKINEAPLFHKDLVRHQYKFEYDDRTYSYQMSVNKNLINFYKDYPATEVEVNFNAPLSESLFQSIQNNIKPLISGKSKEESANLLLALVQKSFQYQTDQEQFGYEKYFFPEELYYYPASDCEDRAVLYTNLVENLLNIEAIGLKYSGHMSSAIYLPEKQRGDFVQFKNKRFIIADGTYEGAPVGMCMSQFKNVVPKVIEIKGFTAPKEENLLATLKIKNPNLNFESKHIVRDESGNTIIVGDFSGTIKFNQKSFSANNRNTVVAKFSSANKLLWLKVLNSNNANYPKLVNYKNGYLYINGAFTGKIQIDGREINSQAADHFVARFDKYGNLSWLDALDLASAKRQGDFIYASKISRTGEISALAYYEVKDYFDNYGFKIYPDGSCALSNSFYGSAGTSYTSNSSANFGSIYQQYFKSLSILDYNKNFTTIASIFYAMRDYNSDITGVQILTDIENTGSEFRNTFPKFSYEINSWQKINKAADYIHVSKSNISYLNDIEFLKEFNIKILAMNSGNLKIECKEGIWIKASGLKFKVNYLLLVADSNNLIVNYSSNHYRKTVSLADL